MPAELLNLRVELDADGGGDTIGSDLLLWPQTGVLLALLGGLVVAGPGVYALLRPAPPPARQ